jgi:hypothetical protein
MDKYGHNMENSRVMLAVIKRISDEDRVELLKTIDDPIKMLEGEWPKIASFIRKPKLLKKLVQVYAKGSA